MSKAVAEVLALYREEPLEGVRARMVAGLLRHVSAVADDDALDILLYILNQENASAIRKSIIQRLAETRPAAAPHVLAKGMFDPEPSIRAIAAQGLTDYAQKEILASHLSPLLDAVTDPVTRTPAESAIRLVTGVPPERITVSQRERIRLGEHPCTIWPLHFAQAAAAGTPPQQRMPDGEDDKATDARPQSGRAPHEELDAPDD